MIECSNGLRVRLAFAPPTLPREIFIDFILKKKYIAVKYFLLKAYYEAKNWKTYGSED